MKLIKVKTNEPLVYGVHTLNAGDVIEMPDNDFEAIKKAGIQIEEVKEKKEK